MTEQQKQQETTKNGQPQAPPMTGWQIAPPLDVSMAVDVLNRVADYYDNRFGVFAAPEFAMLRQLALALPPFAEDRARLDAVEHNTLTVHCNFIGGEEAWTATDYRPDEERDRVYHGPSPRAAIDKAMHPERASVLAVDPSWSTTNDTSLTNVLSEERPE